MSLTLEELVMRKDNFIGRYAFFFYRTVSFLGRIRDLSVAESGTLVIGLEWIAGSRPGSEIWEFVKTNVDFVVESSPYLIISNIGIKGGVSIKPREGNIQILPRDHKFDPYDATKPSLRTKSCRRRFRPINLLDSL